MAGRKIRGVANGGGLRAGLYKGRTTSYVILACIVAACGGLIFGYEVGISGGMTSMPAFLEKFNFHSRDDDSPFYYCQNEDQRLTIFTSSLYLAGIAASLLASHVTKIYGRRLSILCGGLCSLVGAVLSGAAQYLPMLILGRIMHGIGLGFGNQAVPLYLSEMAPAKIRGALNIMFQLAITMGILCANLINYGSLQIRDWGWRLSLGLAGVPASLMTMGGFFLPETPNSLIERGRYEEARRLLTKIRGTEEVDAEYEDIKEASELAVTNPFKAIFQRKNRPQLVMATMMPFFQQFTGINAIMFYAPVLFQKLGFGTDASLYSAVITGAVNVMATLVAITFVDKWGRRALFLEAGVQMFFTQVAIGLIFAIITPLSKPFAVIVVIVICIYVSSFAWSWGPLGWLIPSEIFTLETRSVGQGINVAVNFLFTFVIAQAFLAMLCHMTYGIFLFFAAWVLVMSLFVYFFLPETKSVPIEEMTSVWRRHWYWKRFVPDEDPPALPSYKRDRY
ncbi:hypothetical protein SELMODRAFT_451177 [Selaginella moellendorffii]|uniref:Major facilitator superfamily (MFS) profile domain-containing protein n=1 Tax=Selaginella moellendorffii TaxID=88036 RepID=D8QPD9_SELML|nr:sugar transport protein 7 [Selaginella moellendorffii]EFJ37604.1 hypothetical protein SELMODRAFT_451177 [Selaginella moellendorffii]|eukprot:XP_002960065.1 sugar transport protein 7 [Selaginella moellendorffii]